MRNAENRLFEGGHYQLNFDSANGALFTGVFANTVKFVTEQQLYDEALWARFALQYSFCPDEGGAWRCEYWGKMMRGGCFVCQYSRDEKLYKVLTGAVNALLENQDEDGRLSTYPRRSEFRDWDMWGRKYVMLGLLYYYEICDDPDMRDRVMTAVCKHADYICERVGAGEGKIPVCETSTAWMGVNSMSILEPFVKLYTYTKEQRYFDFAAEIVREGYEVEPKIFKLAEDNELSPYQYPENKAYETMSCFEGLAEYYTITGDEKYLKAIRNFGYRVIRDDMTVIGSCGCTHELFDHSAVNQVNDQFTGIMQETCVTVTFMKLCGMLLRLTGDVTVMECIETAFLNAYLGAVKTHRSPYTVPKAESRPVLTQVLPFDSYSPLRAGKRGALTGGCCIMFDGYFYGCCNCIGSAGIGYFPKVAVMSHEEGVLLNAYLPGSMSVQTPGGQRMSMTLSGNYPYESDVSITLSLDNPETFKLDLRIPAWSKDTILAVNGRVEKVSAGRHTLEREWKDGDMISLSFDMNVYALMPEKVGETAFVAYRRGPVVLGVDANMGIDPAAPVIPSVHSDMRVDAKITKSVAVPDANLSVSVKLADGWMDMVDYASAGKDHGTMMAAWLPIRGA